MKFKNKPKKEQIFILGMFITVMCILMLCLCSCSGSCFGCSFGCENSELYSLGGISYGTSGCCSSSTCQTAGGTIDTNEEESKISDMILVSCTHSSFDCGGDSSCYIGCFIGKDADCGDWAFNCGTTDANETSETSLGCIDDDFGFNCDGNGEMSWIYQFIYELLGI